MIKETSGMDIHAAFNFKIFIDLDECDLNPNRRKVLDFFIKNLKSQCKSLQSQCEGLVKKNNIASEITYYLFTGLVTNHVKTYADFQNVIRARKVPQSLPENMKKIMEKQKYIIPDALVLQKMLLPQELSLSLWIASLNNDRSSTDFKKQLTFAQFCTKLCIERVEIIDAFFNEVNKIYAQTMTMDTGLESLKNMTEEIFKTERKFVKKNTSSWSTPTQQNISAAVSPLYAWTMSKNSVSEAKKLAFLDVFQCRLNAVLERVYIKGDQEIQVDFKSGVLIGDSKDLRTVSNEQLRWFIDQEAGCISELISYQKEHNKKKIEFSQKPTDIKVAAGLYKSTAIYVNAIGKMLDILLKK